MTTQATGERVNQKERTRRALLDAGRRLLDTGDGGYPSIEEVAEEALVSRATAYRYFPSSVDLMCDLYFDSATTGEEAIFGHADDPEDLGERLALVAESTNEFLFEDMLATHLAVKQAADRWLDREGDIEPHEIRPGRRLPLIDQALAPWHDRLDETTRARLRSALALTIGTESAVALRDVAGLDAESARAVASWATQALVEAALRESA